MYSAESLVALSRGLGRYILAVPMRKVKDVATEVLTRPGRYKPVADNLHVKEVVVGDGERRKRYGLCLNPEEAERERAHREQVLKELCAELNLLREREADHPKAACDLLASRRYGRYLTTDYTGRPRLDVAKVKAAWNSFGVATKMRQAKQTAEQFGVQSTPVIGVQGRFVTEPGLAGSTERTLVVTDYLINVVRKGG